MRTYSNRGLIRNSAANAKSKNKAAKYIGRTGLGVSKNPRKAMAAIAAIENIVRLVDRNKFGWNNRPNARPRSARAGRPNSALIPFRQRQNGSRKRKARFSNNARAKRRI